jgi:uncharacterized protein
MTNKIFTIKDVEKIYLSLGMNCNFNCKYCYQKEDKNKILYSNCSTISEEVIKYIKNITKNKKRKTTLIFWGGEPFMYFNTIKDIVNKLKNCNISFSTVSNGSLLTEEIVEFCNNNDFSVGISYDGENTYITRNCDVLNDAEKLNVIKKINKLFVVTVFSAYNFDFLKTFRICYEKIGREVPISIEWLHCDNNTEKSLYTFDKELVKEKLHDFLNEIKKDLLNNTHSKRIDSFYPFFQQVGNNSNSKIPNCMQMRKCINIDLSGNITACHPYGELGNIFDNYEDLIKKYDEKYNIAFEFEDCKTCEWLYQCKGGCPLEYPCDGKKAMCDIKKMFLSETKEFLNKQITII